MVRVVENPPSGSERFISFFKKKSSYSFLILLFLVVATLITFKQLHLIQDIRQQASYDPTTQTFKATFDGDPTAPEPFVQASDFKDFDVQTHSRDSGTWYNPEQMMAEHGTDCTASPDNMAFPTHLVNSYTDLVFHCKNHLMTSIHAGGYGLIVLTPNVMVDNSSGTSTVQFDLSTLRMSIRDWVDVWITPYSENLTLPFDQGNVDLQGIPKTGVHIIMSSFNGQTTFRGYYIQNYQETELEDCWWCTLDQYLPQGESAATRQTFKLTWSKNHVKFEMLPSSTSTGATWVDADTPDLGFSQGVVQFAHHSYNPDKDNSCIAPNPAVNGVSTCSTWHWDNLTVSPAVPFTIIKADKRYVDSTSSFQKITFNSPAPANSYLRFSAVGEPLLSLDNGATSKVISTQTSSQEALNNGEVLWGHAASFFTPIPEGTQSIYIKLRAHPGNWYTENYGMIAQDFAIWSNTPSNPAVTATQPSPTPTPSVTAETSTPTPTLTPSPTPTTIPNITSTPTPSFTSNATGPSTVVSGNSFTINSSVTSTTAFTGNVIVSLYDPNGVQTLKQQYTSQAFSAGQTKSYNTVWQLPVSVTGIYTVKIQVTDTANTLLHYNSNALTFVVAAPTPTPTPTLVPTTGAWKGEYFNNRNLSGTPVLVRNDPVINFNWKAGSPASGIPVDNFSVRWTKQEVFTGGAYTFTVSNDDGMIISVDGSVIYNSWKDQGASTRRFNAGISAGTHTITVLYYEHKGYAVAKTSWVKR